jgi:cysteine desulfurase
MIPQVYLDYCATTPVAPEVRAAMLPTLEGLYGNPSSLHWLGREAGELVERARAQVAESVGAAPNEVCFTSGATEADNLALAGVLRARAPSGGHLISCQTEHHAVLHTAEALARGGYAVTFLPVDFGGMVDPDDVRRAMRPDTALISIMMVNNEVGTIQPVKEIAAIAREHGAIMHTDAVQAVGLFDVDMAELDVDLLALSGHKVYGPKGVGALLVREGTPLAPILFGGPQEGQRRAGTENVTGIVGLGAAMALAAARRADEMARLTRLRAYLVEGLLAAIPGAVCNGPPSGCAPHIASLSFPGADAEMILFRLNAEGIAASMGSACNAESIEPSHVLVAMGLPRAQAESTLRFSLGHPTTPDEIDYLLEVLPVVVSECQL